MRRPSSIWSVAPIVAGTLGIFAYAAWIAAGEPAHVAEAMGWVYKGILAMASAACFLQSFRKGVASCP